MLNMLAELYFNLGQITFTLHIVVHKNNTEQNIPTRQVKSYLTKFDGYII